MKKLMLSLVAVLSVSSAFALSRRCLAPTHCEFEAVKGNFCEEHTCHTEGCANSVMFKQIPNWAKYKPQKRQGGWGQQNNQPQEKRPQQWLVYKYCKAHFCDYMKPQERPVVNRQNPNAPVQDPAEQYMDLNGTALTEALGCLGERLHVSRKYCINHVCAAPRCEKEPMPGQKYCKSHINFSKKENPPKREGAQAETWSEFIKRRAEEKQKAQEEMEARVAARKAARESASSSASSDDSASTPDAGKSSSSAASE